MYKHESEFYMIQMHVDFPCILKKNFYALLFCRHTN